MSAKYIKLPEKTLRIKLEKMDKLYLSIETIDSINLILKDYNHEQASNLAVTAETEILNAKKIQKEIEDEQKKIADEQRAKEIAENGDEDCLKETKLDFTKIITSAEFRAVKDAFGVYKKDENDNQLYQNLNDQFHDHMKTVSQLRMFRVVSLEMPIFDESKSFRFVNTNTGNAKSFEGYEEYFFICFRLFVKPDTNECIYESIWIVNTSDSLSEKVIPFDYSYFKWEEVPNHERYDTICEFLKLTPGVDDNYKSEVYFR